MKIHKGFSLIELMVVIAIIALLVTIAAPYYADYVNKSKVTIAALALNDLNTKAMAAYNEGLITAGMTTLTLDGVDYPDNSAVSSNYSQVAGAVFFAPGDGSINDNAWMFCVYVTDLSFTGYQSGIGGDYSRLCSKVVVNNGIFTTYCGSWTDNNTTDIPAQYLPDECSNTNISAY